MARIARPSDVVLRKSDSPPSSADGEGEDQRREIADAELVRHFVAVECEVADHVAERARIGAVGLEQKVLERDRQPEGREQRHEHAGPQAALENAALQSPADGGHDRQHGDERQEGRKAEGVGYREDEEGGEDGEIAVGEIDDPHDAEHQRQAAGEQRVIAAEQHALGDEIDEAHARPRAAARRRPK